MDQYLTAKINEIKIAQQRGFDTSQAEKIYNENTSLSKFMNLVSVQEDDNVSFKSNLNSSYTKPGTNQILLVLYLDTKNSASVSHPLIKEFFDYFNNLIITNPSIDYQVILVSDVVLTHTSKKSFDNKPGDKVTFMLIEDMGYDPFEHNFTPKQYIMSEEATLNYLQSFKIENRFTLALIQPNDPIVIRLNAKRGDLIFCDRYRARAFVKKHPFVRVVN